ncbi:uncharacterized protein PGTG_08826 [Puccinia graminis f. sp. tritici CRL 75-36-700-3]|uniref:C2H2-type domain-containing protein n=1 Tax=Puccinia graminis f. sp. tritici (strain CRL 75-36-700-3 / race SCCL) TaxID=418459 RepID=E3KE97_PUCGT|nr:uncharacterized protein PGTG_08826 [Puccinia graminis f. sp. tritici CRL 75-36-700-3]EFP82630.2 hypothetical protein PGTG_08826 [Puccinia graminis f. sp. tritici CRL 75-36-700-3]
MTSPSNPDPPTHPISRTIAEFAEHMTLSGMEPDLVELAVTKCYPSFFPSTSLPQDANNLVPTSPTTTQIPVGFNCPVPSNSIPPQTFPNGSSDTTLNGPLLSGAIFVETLYSFPSYQTGMPLSPFSLPNFPEVDKTKPSRWAFGQSELASVPVAGPSSWPYIAPPMGLNFNFNQSVTNNRILDGWQPDGTLTDRFLGSELSNAPVAGPSSQPYTPPTMGVSYNFGDSVPNSIPYGQQVDQLGTESASEEIQNISKQKGKKRVYESPSKGYQSDRKFNVDRRKKPPLNPEDRLRCTKDGHNTSFGTEAAWKRHNRIYHGAPRARPRGRTQKASDKKYPCKYANQGCKKTYKSLNDWGYYNHLMKDHHEVVILTGPVRREMVSTSSEEHTPAPGPSREPSS